MSATEEEQWGVIMWADKRPNPGRYYYRAIGPLRETEEAAENDAKPDLEILEFIGCALRSAMPEEAEGDLRKIVSRAVEELRRGREARVMLRGLSTMVRGIAKDAEIAGLLEKTGK